MISNCISNDTPPQMYIMNMLIPIRMHFCACLLIKSLFHLKLEHGKPHKAACHPMKCGMINDVKLFQTVYWVYTVANF